MLHDVPFTLEFRDFQAGFFPVGEKPLSGHFVRSAFGAVHEESQQRHVEANTATPPPAHASIAWIHSVCPSCFSNSHFSDRVSPGVLTWVLQKDA